MRVLLVNLPWRVEGRSGVRAGSRWPFTAVPEHGGVLRYIPFPFFLAYTTSLLKSRSHDARLLDAVAEGLDETQTKEAIRAFDAGLLVIETSTPSFDNDIRIAGAIAAGQPRTKIVLCGPHPSVFAGQILEEYGFIYGVAVGEYEYTLAELARHLDRGLDISRIAGLAFRRGRRSVVNHRRQTIRDLDALPWPEREDVPLERYNDGFCSLPVPNVQMLSSRGCIFKCSFCLWPQALYGESRHRRRSPEKVVQEMKYLLERYDFKAVYFDDDTFNVDREHVRGICRQIKLRNITIPWAVMARADLFDRQTLEEMARAGLYAVKYGVESASPVIQRACGKSLNMKKTREVIGLTKQLGIKVHLTFCVGLPGETRQTLQETADFINACGPDGLQVSFATPFPGTRYHAYALRKKWLLSGNRADYDGNRTCIVRTRHLQSTDLMAFRDQNFGAIQ